MPVVVEVPKIINQVEARPKAVTVVAGREAKGPETLLHILITAMVAHRPQVMPKVKVVRVRDVMPVVAEAATEEASAAILIMPAAVEAVT